MKATISKAMLNSAGFTEALKSDIKRICNNGQFFTVVFQKADGSQRRMTARLGVKKHFRTPDGKGIHKRVDYPNRLTVWDCSSGEYRTISLDRLERLTMAGKTVIFK